MVEIVADGARRGARGGLWVPTVTTPTGEDTSVRLAALYTRYAEEEFHNRSPLYEAIARGIAGNRDVRGFLATLPPDKWQPISSVRHVCGLAAGWPDFQEKLLISQPARRSAAVMSGAVSIFPPALPRRGDVRTLLLAGVQDFFYS